jgi:hypothetical protein
MSEEKIEASMDRDSLYREEMISDRKMGTIRVMTPIKPDGSDDDARKVLYVGQAQIMTPMGALPVAFEIEADSLDQAVDGYAEAAKEAIDNTIKELKELQRQAQSSIVVPGSGGGAGGLGGGGMPGGGGIQIP